MTTWFVISAFVAGAAALGLAALLLWKNRWSSFNRSAASALAASGLIQIGHGLALLDTAHTLVWLRAALLAELWLAATLLYIGLSLLTPLASGTDGVAKWRARAIALLACALGGLVWSDKILVLRTLENGVQVIGAGSLARVVFVFLLLSLALGIAQLESILRALGEPLRYRLKFVLIGFGALAGYLIYQASQFLLVPAWQADEVL